MIRTYPICQAHAHPRQESLRGILRRLERDIASGPHRVAPPWATRGPATVRRRAF